MCGLVHQGNSHGNGKVSVDAFAVMKKSERQYASARWERAWHSTELEALYAIAYYGRLLEDLPPRPKRAAVRWCPERLLVKRWNATQG